MGYGDQCISSQDYNECDNYHYPRTDNSGDFEKLIPHWFYLNISHRDEREKYLDF